MCGGMNQLSPKSVLTLDQFHEPPADAIGDIIETEHRYPLGVRKVLAVLEDGRWHTNREIIEKSGQIHITARIFEARNQGCNIEYLRKGKYHLYRWIK